MSNVAVAGLIGLERSRPGPQGGAVRPRAATRFGEAAVLQLAGGSAQTRAEAPGSPPQRAPSGQVTEAAAADGDAHGGPGATEVSLPGAANAAARPREGAATGSESAGGTQLTEAEGRQVQKLQARDREVRTHEQAHKATGGSYAGAIQFEHERGPDGKQYAVGGHVPIDVAPIDDDPRATVEKMGRVRRAALAPADPSAADRAVASKAAAYAGEARAKLAQGAANDAEGTTSAETSEPATTSERRQPTSDSVAAPGQGRQSVAPELAHAVNRYRQAMTPPGTGGGAQRPQLRVHA